MKSKIMENLTDIEVLIDNAFGKRGSIERDAIEERAELFVVVEMLKEARKEAKLTQEQLAQRIGAKKVIFQGLKMVKQIFNFLRSFVW